MVKISTILTVGVVALLIWAAVSLPTSWLGALGGVGPLALLWDYKEILGVLAAGLLVLWMFGRGEK